MVKKYWVFGPLWTMKKIKEFNEMLRRRNKKPELKNNQAHLIDLKDMTGVVKLSELKKEIENFECFLHDHGYFDENLYEEWTKLKQNLVIKDE